METVANHKRADIEQCQCGCTHRAAQGQVVRLDKRCIRQHYEAQARQALLQRDADGSGEVRS